MPALFTSTSMRPNSATVASTSAPHWSQSPTWQADREWPAARARGSPRPPPRTRSSLRLATTTSAPGLGEPEGHRPAEALAAAGDDDDLAGRVEGGDRHRPLRVSRRCPRSRSGCGGRTACRPRPGRPRRVAARVGIAAGRRRPGGSTPLSTAPNPTVAQVSSRQACTAASAAKPSRRIASTSGRDASTYASRPGQTMRRLSRAGAGRSAALAPSAPRSAPRLAVVARRGEVGRAAGRRSRRRARPCCRPGCRAARARRRAGRTRCACSPRRGRTPRRSRRRRSTISSASRSKSVRPGPGLTGPAPACRRPPRSAMRWSAAGQVVERRPRR